VVFSTFVVLMIAGGFVALYGVILYSDKPMILAQEEFDKRCASLCFD
jgi:hypothetical protein